ncbi:MAG: hypothetical protein ACM3SM_03160 [Bacteroidota bacterium]
MKKLFKNYTYEFDKNEKKLLITFCKQSLKQMEGDQRFYAGVRSFSSIVSKLESDSESVKLTKEELSLLTYQLKENVKFLKQKMQKGWFLKKFMYKTMYKQYQNLLDNHFNE